MSVRVVIDTNILVSALMSRENMCRKILRQVYQGRVVPIVGNALFAEYESLMNRDALYEHGPFDRNKRNIFLDNFLSQCHWVDIQFHWRPNLRDEGDNHVLELAVAGNAPVILTQNIKDFRGAELMFDDVKIVHPRDYYEFVRMLFN